MNPHKLSLFMYVMKNEFKCLRFSVKLYFPVNISKTQAASITDKVTRVKLKQDEVCVPWSLLNLVV